MLNWTKKAKLNISISIREKIMLITLMIVLLFAGYYKFIYSKQIQTVNQLKLEEEENSSKLQNLQANIVLNKKLNKDVEATDVKVKEVSSDFFPTIIEEKIIVIIDDMINKNNIVCNKIEISEVSIETVAEKNLEKNKKTSIIEEMVKKYLEVMKGSTPVEAKVQSNNNQNSSKEATQEQTPLEAKKITLTLNFAGSYEEVMSFIDDIKGFYKRIIISNIEIEATGENLKCKMVLDFYAVPQLTEEDIDYNKWQYNGDYGKDNMFEDITKETSNQSINQNIQLPSIGN